MRVKCHNCGITAEYPDAKEFVCVTCGAVNVVPVHNGTVDAEVMCLAPTGFEWRMPAGKIGNEILGFRYVTAQGTQMSREEYMREFGIDPEIALQYMRKNRGVKVGGR